MIEAGKSIIVDLVVRYGTETRALERMNEGRHILLAGEPAVVWSVKRDTAGAILYAADGTTPLLDKRQFLVMGDGVTKFDELMPYWPVRKSSFNSIAAGKQGQARDFKGNLLSTSGTATYNSLDEFISDFVHPEKDPFFTYFNAGDLSPIEVGTAHDPNRAYSWTAAPESAVKPASVRIVQIYNGASATMASGLPPSGSFAGWAGDDPLKPAVIIPTAIGAKITYQLQGQSRNSVAMPPLTLEREAQGKVAWFMYSDAQALIPTLTVKIGDPAITVMGDAGVKAVCEEMLGRDDGEVNDPATALGNVNFGTIIPDGGESGKRLYALYPTIYRSSINFNNALGVRNAATRTRALVLVRNGVNINYTLMAMDLRVVGQIRSGITFA